MSISSSLSPAAGRSLPGFINAYPCAGISIYLLFSVHKLWINFIDTAH